MTAKRPSAFTLIELLIVTLIVAIIAGTVYDLVNSVANQHDMHDARVTIQAASVRTLGHWRRDALLAEQGELAPTGASMTFRMRGELDEAFEVVYELEEGRLVRRSSSPNEPPLLTLCPNAKDLNFASRSRSWSMSWQHIFHNGRQEQSWPQQGFAAPLF